MSKLISATVKYTVPDTFDDAGDEVNGNFEYLIIDTVQDAIDEMGEQECKKLLQKAIKIQSANKARVKLMSENKHLAYAQQTEEQKAESKLKRAKNANAIKKLATLSASQLAELGIEL